MEEVLVPLSVILVPLTLGAIAVGKAMALTRAGESAAPPEPAHRDPDWHERPPVLAANPEPSAVRRAPGAERPESRFTRLQATRDRPQRRACGLSRGSHPGR